MSGSWHVVATVRGAEAAAALSDMFDATGAAVAAFETDERAAAWRLDVYAAAPVLSPALEVRLSLAAAAARGELIDIREEKLRERDWLAENRLAFPPLRVGRFFIHGSHYGGPIPAGAIAIKMDAATAFGSGEHPSTRGCLLALNWLARQRRFRHPLDIGTGTGILAIAAAKTFRRAVVARDVDPAAVRLARHNAIENGVSGWISVGVGAGYRGRDLAGRRYDLVFANILARPLAHMARDLARQLAPGGTAVLSGLLRRQEPLVLTAHRVNRLRLQRRIPADGWSTLILKKGR